MRPSRICGRLAAALLVAVGVFGMQAAQPAAAASPLVASDPAPHEEVTEQPGSVTLAFSRTVDKKMLKVLVLDQSGEDVTQGDPDYYGSSVLVWLNTDLKPSTYTVMWKINQTNGQPQGGAFQFSWGAGKWTDLSKADWAGIDQEPSAMANPDAEATGPADTAAPTGDATGGVPVVVIETPGPSEPPSATPTPLESPSPEASASNPAQTPAWLWWAVGGAVAVVVIAGGAVLTYRHQKRARRRAR